MRGPVLALLSALLFALTVPASKVLLESTPPLILAGLLYLGAGIALGLFGFVRKTVLAPNAPGRRVPAARRPRTVDYLRLAGAIATGGVAAPIALLSGLQRTPAATAALLLSFEVVFTALWAGAFFREHVGRRVGLAVAAVTVGGVLLGLDPDGDWGFSFGALGVVGACALWGLDNNLTAVIKDLEAVRVARIKGFVAGGVNLGLGLLFGSRLPGWGASAGALAVGGAAYGLSLVLFVLALRRLGAARTGAYFGSAPFLAAGLSLLVTGETPGSLVFVAAGFMAAGAWLMMGEQHVHEHVHAGVVHAPWHAPDVDHRHEH